MSYILCQTKKAENPYFIENIGINIYTLEELCYYFHNNLYLIDQTIINEELCRWISKELELPGLAAKLRAVIGKFSSAEDVLYPVFKEINYLNYEELRSLNIRLEKYNKEPLTVKEKKKGDSLVENGMYLGAIEVYQKVLRRGDLSDQGEGFASMVWNNLGCAYSYLFQMDKAMECFWEAYERIHTRETLKSYLFAYAQVYTPIEYENRLEELRVDPATRQEMQEQIKAFEDTPEMPVYEHQVEGLLEKLTKEYHRSTAS